MLTTLHDDMNQDSYSSNETIYRKRAEPYRIVSYDLLVRTNKDTAVLKQNNGILVNDSGTLSSDEIWHPLRKSLLPIAVNNSSWAGLVKRFNESKENPVRA